MKSWLGVAGGMTSGTDSTIFSIARNEKASGPTHTYNRDSMPFLEIATDKAYERGLSESSHCELSDRHNAPTGRHRTIVILSAGRLCAQNG